MPEVALDVISPALRAGIEANMDGFARSRLDLDDRRHAAVAVMIVTGENDTPCWLLTRRAPGLKAHRGQLALPGGRLDPGETPVDAALREVHEEVGVVVEAADVLGVLDDYATRSGFVMTPVVVWAAAAVPAPDPAEVAEIFTLPLAELDRPDAPRLIDIPESDRPVIQMPVVGDHWVNAPTAAVLYQFREVCLHGRDTRVAHFEQPVWAWR